MTISVSLSIAASIPALQIEGDVRRFSRRLQYSSISVESSFSSSFHRVITASDLFQNSKTRTIAPAGIYCTNYVSNLP